MKNKIFGPVFSIITPFNKFERVDYKDYLNTMTFIIVEDAEFLLNGLQ